MKELTLFTGYFIPGDFVRGGSVFVWESFSLPPPWKYHQAELNRD